MRRSTSSPLAALGFRVKSGWAVAVLVTGPVEAPQALDRRAVDLSDPAVAASRQPYHAAMGLLQTDQAKVDGLRKVIRAVAGRSVPALIDEHQKAGHRLCACGVVIGSDIDPAKITNSHIRAHALEGQLFRTVLQEALEARGLACHVITERRIYAQAAEAFNRSADDLKRTLTALGRSLVGPWRADEKTAALAAWLALAQG